MYSGPLYSAGRVLFGTFNFGHLQLRDLRGQGVNLVLEQYRKIDDRFRLKRRTHYPNLSNISKALDHFLLSFQVGFGPSFVPGCRTWDWYPI